MNKKEIIAILRAVVDLLERSDYQDLKSLLEGKASLLIGKRLETDPETLQIKINWERAKKRLEMARSPEEGRQILKEEGIERRKQSLEELARHYDVAIGSESKNSLANHIVDVVVGSRIYSETMKNIDLQSRAKRRTAM